MKLTLKEFRQLIRTNLEEAMATPQQAKSQGLALSFIDIDDGQMAVLYSPKEILAAIEKVQSDGSDADAIVSSLGEAFEQHIKAMVRFQKAVTGECNGAYEVNRVAAVPGGGYGPLMYQIAMAAVPSHRIMPDRENVSAQAGTIWNKMSGAKKLKLDDEQNPQTEPLEDDCKILNDPKREYLDYAYEGQGVSSLSGLNDAHEDFLTDITFMLNDYSGSDLKQVIDRTFEQAALGFFQGRMS